MFATVQPRRRRRCVFHRLSVGFLWVTMDSAWHTRARLAVHNWTLTSGWASGGSHPCSMISLNEKKKKKKVDGGVQAWGSVGVPWQKTGIFGMQLQFISADFLPVEEDDAPHGGLNKPWPKCIHGGVFVLIWTTGNISAYRQCKLIFGPQVLLPWWYCSAPCKCYRRGGGRR